MYATNLLISGVTPGPGGTGRFLQALLPYAENKGFQFVFPPAGRHFSPEEWEALCGIQDANILVIHPQYIGPHVIVTLANNKNQITLYVLDNWFFCIRSYNYRIGVKGECLDCLNALENCHSSCQTFPLPYPKEYSQQVLTLLKTVAHKINFVCQNHGQASLLKRHFGPEIKTCVVGMRTSEIDTTASLSATHNGFDVVYHAECVLAKGVDLALQMAERLPHVRFLFPFDYREVTNVMGTVQPTPNMVFQPMRWESGLAQAVAEAKLVLCPSLWSAPVEGALLKSLFYNGNVAVFDTEFGFQKEIADGIVLRLTSDFDLALKQLQQQLVCQREQRARARAWVTQYIESVELDRIVDVAMEGIA